MDDFLDIFSLKGSNAAISSGAGIPGLNIAMGFGKVETRVAIYDIVDKYDIVKNFKNKDNEAKFCYIDIIKIK